MFGHGLPGIYIALEGIRCCGKSTQAVIYAERLKREFPGREIILTKEPGGTEKADQIREVIVSAPKKGQDLTPWAQVNLFAASRAQAIAELIRPALERGAVVISDRCFLSSLCYQGLGLNLGWQNILEANQMALDGVTPDLIIFPDISVELSAERLALREKRDNVYDRKNDDYFRIVRDAYLFFSQNYSDHFLVVDGTLSADIQAEIIWEKTRSFLREGNELKRELSGGRKEI